MKILLLLSLAAIATAHAVWMAFPADADGTLGKGRVFADVPAMAKDHPGVHQGNHFAASPGGTHVYSVDGKRLWRIRTKTKGNGW